MASSSRFPPRRYCAAHGLCLQPQGRGAIAPQVSPRRPSPFLRRTFRHLDDGARQVDLHNAKTIKSGFGGGPSAVGNGKPTVLDRPTGDERMNSPVPTLRSRRKLCVALGVAAMLFVGAP